MNNPLSMRPITQPCSRQKTDGRGKTHSVCPEQLPPPGNRDLRPDPSKKGRFSGCSSFPVLFGAFPKTCLPEKRRSKIGLDHLQTFFPSGITTRPSDEPRSSEIIRSNNMLEKNLQFLRKKPSQTGIETKVFAEALGTMYRPLRRRSFP